MSPLPHVPEVTDATFDAEVLSSPLPVLVDFTAAWCSPCRALAPVVERVAVESEGRLKVVTVDTDASPEVARRYGVRAVPTLLVFRGGQKTAGHLGLTTREKILQMVGP